MVDLSKIGKRERLKPKRRDEPHWQRITNGCYVGFRPSRRGAWVARAYDADIGKYQRTVFSDPIASVKLENFGATICKDGEGGWKLHPRSFREIRQTSRPNSDPIPPLTRTCLHCGQQCGWSYRRVRQIPTRRGKRR